MEDELHIPTLLALKRDEVFKAHETRTPLKDTGEFVGEPVRRIEVNNWQRTSSHQQREIQHEEKRATAAALDGLQIYKSLLLFEFE